MGYIVLATSKDNNSIRIWKVFGSLEAAEDYSNNLDSSKWEKSVCEGWW